MFKQLIPITAVIDHYVTLTKNTSIEPENILYLSHNGFEQILTAQIFVHDIVLMNVINYKAQLPKNFRYVAQAGFLDTTKYPAIKLEQVTEYNRQIYGSDCKLETKVLCPGCKEFDQSSSEVITIDADYNYLISRPEYSYRHMKHFFSGRAMDKNILPRDNRSTIYPEFKLMRKTSHNFFNVPYHVNECINLGFDSKIEYNIDLPNMLVNRKEGQVILAYMGAATDDSGYLLIPNTSKVLDAIVYYIEEILAYQDLRYNKNDRGNNNFYQTAVSNRIRAFKKAKAQIDMPDADEVTQFAKNHWNRFIPNYKHEAHHNQMVGDKELGKQFLLSGY